ncbi:hypothetical protein EUGRSUZ_J01087 [Eucalyptus grandis]|uniref:Uncharacterized protein n=2 Tax=Eucalyptus grandis TaxID=71139 RepID=A0ACC3J418_EUCGR|nr:hypothetical protein EUGRSUZ_J01087 [Eucalyptus grandis]
MKELGKEGERGDDDGWEVAWGSQSAGVGAGKRNATKRLSIGVFRGAQFAVKYTSRDQHSQKRAIPFCPKNVIPSLPTDKWTRENSLSLSLSLRFAKNTSMTKHAAEHGSFSAKDYQDPPPAPLIDPVELGKWSFYRALIAEFIATLLFLYITVLTVIGYKSQTDDKKPGTDACGGVGILGIAWAFGGMIFVLVYCTAGISGGHINPAVTFGLFLARKVSLVRAIMYMVAQCLGAICGVGLVKLFQKSYYEQYGGGANMLAEGYKTRVGLGAEIIGTFVLVYTVFSATDPKRSARDSHVPVMDDIRYTHVSLIFLSRVGVVIAMLRITNKSWPRFQI